MSEFRSIVEAEVAKLHGRYAGQPVTEDDGSDEVVLQEEMDAETAKSKAVTDPAQLPAVFAKLRSGQTIWLSYKGSMSNRDYAPYVVGRRTASKKEQWWQEKVGLGYPGGEKRVPLTLYKSKTRDSGEDRISLAVGNMAADLVGIYVP